MKKKRKKAKQKKQNQSPNPKKNKQSGRLVKFLLEPVFGLFIITSQLSKTRKVSVTNFKGANYVNIREYYEDKNSGELKPTKKGIMLNLKQWKDFAGFVDEINEAVAELE